MYQSSSSIWVAGIYEWVQLDTGPNKSLDLVALNVFY